MEGIFSLGATFKSHIQNCLKRDLGTLYDNFIGRMSLEIRF